MMTTRADPTSSETLSRTEVTALHQSPICYRTEQENFWAGEFGREYIGRNEGEKLVTANSVLFGRILRAAPGVKSVVELGCNIGLNLQALHRIDDRMQLCGYEINPAAAARARSLGIADIRMGTILDNLAPHQPHGGLQQFDLAFTKTVLIHINPDELAVVYRNLHALSSRYVMVCEYYNPTPVTVRYRGNEERLFKRDFAGELMDQHGLRLLDYGFAYHRDSYFPHDDLSWFLMEKVA